MTTRRGFTVVELMVAVVLFGIGILAGLALLGTGYRYQGEARLQTELTVVAEMKAEELRAIAGTDLPDTVALVPGGDLATDVDGYWDTIELDARVFARRWQIGSGPAATRKVGIRVRAIDPPAARENELWTYVLHE